MLALDGCAVNGGCTTGVVHTDPYTGLDAAHLVALRLDDDYVPSLPRCAVRSSFELLFPPLVL